MRIIQIRSVPSSGTTFLKKTLINNGYKVKVKHWTPELALETGRVFAPIRNPKLVWETWQHLDREGEFEPTLEKFYTIWSLFNHNWMHNNELVVVPVDLPSHQYASLWQLRTALSAKVCVDWNAKFNESGAAHTSGRYPVPEMQVLYKLPVVRHFYSYYDN